MHRRLSLSSLVLLLAASVAGCGKDEPAPKPDPFAPVPECMPGTLPVTPLKGDRQLVLSSLGIAEYAEGFDLDLDGKIDNKLSPLRALANPSIADTFKTDLSLIVPLEVFGWQGQDSACTKLSFYLGRVVEDGDGDGRSTTLQPGKADCDDTNAKVSPSEKDVAGNRLDDDCDGYADNTSKGVPGDDAKDADGDGFSPKQGDCDDRADVPAAKDRHPGAKDVCDGIDQDCDGVPDTDASCSYFADNKRPLHLTGLSFVDDKGQTPAIPPGGTTDGSAYKPAIVFPDGSVKGNTLTAGPDRFQLTIPIDDETPINLLLSGARLELKMQDKPSGAYVMSGKLGGVLQAQTLAQIRNLDAGGILKPEQSLLDAVFAGALGTVLGLDSDAEQHYLPDIDVDRDGIETFWQANPVAGQPQVVDTCRDGDGTIIKSNFDGKGTSCALAIDPKTGKPRFVDGISVALKFTAVPAVFKDIVLK